MSAIITVGAEESWDLPEGTDLAEVQDRVRSAMETGTVAVVPVRRNDQAATLLFRGDLVAAVYVGDVPATTFKSGILHVRGCGEWSVPDEMLDAAVNAIERAMRHQIVAAVDTGTGVLAVNGALLDVAVTIATSTGTS